VIQIGGWREGRKRESEERAREEGGCA
jgi:hypothetical protein